MNYSTMRQLSVLLLGMTYPVASLQSASAETPFKSTTFVVVDARRGDQRLYSDIGSLVGIAKNQLLLISAGRSPDLTVLDSTVSKSRDPDFADRELVVSYTTSRGSIVEFRIRHVEKSVYQATIAVPNAKEVSLTTHLELRPIPHNDFEEYKVRLVNEHNRAVADRFFDIAIGAGTKTSD